MRLDGDADAAWIISTSLDGRRLLDHPARRRRIPPASADSTNATARGPQRLRPSVAALSSPCSSTSPVRAARFTHTSSSNFEVASCAQLREAARAHGDERRHESQESGRVRCRRDRRREPPPPQLLQRALADMRMSACSVLSIGAVPAEAARVRGVFGGTRQRAGRRRGHGSLGRTPVNCFCTAPLKCSTPPAPCRPRWLPLRRPRRSIRTPPTPSSPCSLTGSARRRGRSRAASAVPVPLLPGRRCRRRSSDEAPTQRIRAGDHGDLSPHATIQVDQSWSHGADPTNRKGQGVDVHHGRFTESDLLLVNRLRF
uniref:Uncharacterized protein n=1 Tax=Setaria italica TaxID=4555 RepID=K3Z851_SETIT